MGKGKEFYREQLALMSSGDIDGLLEQHYHEDAVMITFDGIRRGREELKKYYVDTLKIMGQITYLKTEYFAETEDVIIFKAVITSEGLLSALASLTLMAAQGTLPTRNTPS